MIVTPLKTGLIQPATLSLINLLDASIDNVPESSVLAITSKIISICEARIVTKGKNSINKDELIIREADYYLPSENSKYGHHFTVVNHTLIGAAGIDESNGGDNYILLPEDPQATANMVRKYLQDRFRLKWAGVIVTDSTSIPFRLGAVGVCLGHSGFKALNSYVGRLDLCGRPFATTRSNISEGLAASAVLAMGEGAERTPLALIQDVPFVKFQSRDPSAAELQTLKVSFADDLFAPFLEKAAWQKGGKK